VDHLAQLLAHVRERNAIDDRAEEPLDDERCAS
jgi:hypothetical protein